MIKTLAKSIREYKKASILTPLTVSCEVVLECTIPFITAELVNRIKGGCGMDTIAKLGGLLVLMAVLSLSFGVLSGYICNRSSACMK